MESLSDNDLFVILRLVIAIGSEDGLLQFMMVLKSPKLCQFKTANVATFSTVDDASWEDLLHLIGLVMNDLDTLTDLDDLKAGVASQQINALATRFLLKLLTAMFKGLVCKVPSSYAHVTELVVKSKFSDSSGADDQTMRLFRQNFRKRKDLGQRWLDLTESNNYGLGILAMYPVGDGCYALSNTKMRFMTKTNFQLMLKYLEKTKGHYLRRLYRVVEPFLVKWMQRNPGDNGPDLIMSWRWQ